MRKAHSIFLLTTALVGSVSVGMMHSQPVNASPATVVYTAYKQAKANFQTEDAETNELSYRDVCSGVELALMDNLTYTKVIQNKPIAGVSQTLLDSIIKAEKAYKVEQKRLKEERKRKKEEEERKRKELEAQQATEIQRQQSLESRLLELFGYVPAQWELNELKGIVQAECGNTEPENGIEAVFYTIINRVKSSRFPNTIHGVISQRNQFETYSRGLQNSTPNDRVKSVWNKILYENTSNPYPNIMFFTAGNYNAYCRPAFRINNHYFGY